MAFGLFALPVLAGELAIAPVPMTGPVTGPGDLDTIRVWGPAQVVTLLTDAEMTLLALQPFGEAVGARWWHLPIADYGTPEGDTLARWPFVSGVLLAALAQGQRVLIHCRGGCGRSGMIALRLMIDAGEAADTALARLRAVRPCAVETDAQMAWAVNVAKAP